MIDNTINDDKTIAGGGEGAILARWYRAFRRQRGFSALVLV